MVYLYSLARLCPETPPALASPLVVLGVGWAGQELRGVRDRAGGDDYRLVLTTAATTTLTTFLLTLVALAATDQV